MTLIRKCTSRIKLSSIEKTNILLSLKDDEVESIVNKKPEVYPSDYYRSRIDKAEGFSEIWDIVRETVNDYTGEHRGGMLLFLDDLPLRLGAYHPLGTNNIVLNRTLVHKVKTTTKSKKLLNAFVYNLLGHEYLHALGHISEAEVCHLIYEISKECFGEEHTVTRLAKDSPWTLLSDIPLSGKESPRQGIEIVKDFEKQNQKYII